MISKALIKYGHLNFSLEIIEYCEPTKCIEKEQYFMDLLNPAYNICRTAGSPLGRKHSSVTRAEMVASWTEDKKAFKREFMIKLHAADKHKELLKRLRLGRSTSLK